MRVGVRRGATRGGQFEWLFDPKWGQAFLQFPIWVCGYFIQIFELNWLLFFGMDVAESRFSFFEGIFVLKKLAAILAMTVALPAFALVAEKENNGSIALAQYVGIAGTGTEVISGAIVGNLPGGKADYDFYDLGRFATGGNIAVTLATQFDPFVALYNSTGQVVAYNDDYFGSDSYFSYKVAVEDTYYLAILGFGSGLLGQPFNAATAGNIGSTGSYQATVAYSGALVETQSVPEPSGLALGMLAVLGGARLRRRIASA